MTNTFRVQQSADRLPQRRTLIGSVVALLCGSNAWAQSTESPAAPGAILEEVVVTASRREESLSKVPISVQAFSQEQMDTQGLKSLDDVARYTPGLTLTRVGFTGANQISIRGISSAAGAGTTGIYIDDTPVQVRNLGFGAGNAFPGLFDLERVEVLRGPQGTLFGAGSEGGTVRFIQAQASLNKYSTYARAEGSKTENGDPSYEFGAAFGGPIIEDKLGFRVSAFFRRDGGFIHAVNGNYQVRDPTGAAYGHSVAFTPTQTVDDAVNWSTTAAFRVGLKLAATESLTLTPSVLYQKQHDNNGLNTTYWLTQSNTGERYYSIPWYTAANPEANPRFTAMNAPTNAQGDDVLTLSALAINWNLGSTELISNTSFFHRDQNQWADFTQGYVQFYQQALFPGGDYAPPGYKAMTNYLNGQRNFVQELRLQSSSANARLNWVVGAFYSHNRQSASQPLYVNFTQNAPAIGFGPDINNYAFADGPPYGPGSTALANYLGINNGPNSLDYYASWETVEQQLAAFAQADLNITKQLKLTLGLRFSRNKLSYQANFGGPETNGNAPYGLPCLPNTFCAAPEDFITPGQYAVGTGPFTPVFPSSSAESTETATTPKVGISYQIDEANMIYATAAKGFRPAGASLRVPSVCGSDLATFGYADAQGHSTQPLTYGSDSVWSYEVGSKNRLLDGHLVLDGSVYEIRWSNIQTDVFLPNCGYDFVTNLANATSKGFDLAFQAKPFAPLTLSGSIGYNSATFDRNAVSPSGVLIYPKGSAIPGSGAPWTASLSGEYDLDLFGDQNWYLRTDWTRTNRLRPTGAMLPGAPLYDPLLQPDAAYAIVSSRLGVRLAGMDVSLFVNNLFDANPLVGMQHSILYDPQEFRAAALRPRTYGITLTYRH